MTPDALVEQPTSAAEIREIRERYEVALHDAKVMEQSVDGRFVDAYTGGFLLAKLVVRASGYRVKGTENHRDMFSAIPWLLGSGVQGTADALEAARRVRNRDLYDGVGFVDAEDVDALLARVAALEEVVLGWLEAKYSELNPLA